MISSSVSNEISRTLPASQVGSGIGLFQLLQFFGGAFSGAMEWQHGLPQTTAYSNIFWGLTAIALLAIGSSYAYLRSASVPGQRSCGSLEA